LDQLIYIPLPDLASRLSIFNACLRNSPVDEEVDLEAMAKATHGFSGRSRSSRYIFSTFIAIPNCVPPWDVCAFALVSRPSAGADITEICQRAAKTAISQSIDEDLERRRQVEAGTIKDVAEIPDKVTTITKAHFQLAMSGARRSVPDSVIRKYEDYVNSMKSSVKEATSFKFDDVLEEVEGKSGGEEGASKAPESDDDLYE
jgi:transitional endoplasmic reticulum ATPase